ncbi:MAG: hypothetical protein J1E40_09930, partial [Oscillospiraceae bacterium]|nr:hypothetical protein [Oscillospiraceae bacterium]
MKKSISGIAAFAMAVVTAVSSIPMTVAYGEDVIDVYEEDYYMPYEPGVSATSDKDDQAMKEALTIVKRRVTVPEEISEFTYSTSLSYGTKSFNFNWTTPNDAKEHKYVKVSIVGNIITDYTYFDGTTSRSGPRFAKMTEDQLLEKAKEHIKKLDPTIADKAEVTLSYFGLNSNYVNINIRRFENGIPVNNNGGSITLDKDTGELKSFSITWADNAVFSDPGAVKTEAETREAYKQICNLTPYYKSTTDWNTKKVTTRIVYDPDMTSEIDAFTGQPSTIWDDMKSAEGTRFSSDVYANPMTGAGNYDEVSADGAIFDGVEFTKEELKKIQQDKKLLTKEQVTELLKKDKFVALTDDYVISSYKTSGEKYPIMLLDNDKGISTPDKDKESEKFYIDAVYTIKSELKNSYSGYKYITVQLDGETGEILSMRKGNADNNELPKLDVQKSKAIADEVAKTYCKDIIKEYKASASNSDPAQTWTVRVGGKDVERSETARTFTYKRYVNGIQVYADSISVRVDSNGVVTLYDCYHSENAAFPSADDILTPEQAFDKLYQQQSFNYYYDG